MLCSYCKIIKKMVEEKPFGEVEFISYLDDDGHTKNQKVILLSKDLSGVTFRFPNNEIDKIFIPNIRLLKIKGRVGGIL